MKCEKKLFQIQSWIILLHKILVQNYDATTFNNVCTWTTKLFYQRSSLRGKCLCFILMRSQVRKIPPRDCKIFGYFHNFTSHSIPTPCQSTLKIRSCYWLELKWWNHFLLSSNINLMGRHTFSGRNHKWWRYSISTDETT